MSYYFSHVGNPSISEANEGIVLTGYAIHTHSDGFRRIRVTIMESSKPAEADIFKESADHGRIAWGARIGKSRAVPWRTLPHNLASANMAAVDKPRWALPGSCAPEGRRAIRTAHPASHSPLHAAGLWGPCGRSLPDSAQASGAAD